MGWTLPCNEELPPGIRSRLIDRTHYNKPHSRYLEFARLILVENFISPTPGSTPLDVHLLRSKTFGHSPEPSRPVVSRVLKSNAEDQQIDRRPTHRRLMKSICIILPYFGTWPEWMPLFLQSCRNNPTIDWMFFTDCGACINSPENVRYTHMTWPECAAFSAKRCRINQLPVRPYKLCDFRFAFGYIFRQYVQSYDIVGFGDIDVIYGDLRTFLTPAVLSHTLITFNENHVSGHLTLMQNTRSTIRQFRKVDAWRHGAEKQEYASLDEGLGHYQISDVYCIESFNTPLSPYTPWTDGTHTFPLAWYYKGGRLYNSIDGPREFMYLHFMRYKHRWRMTKQPKIVHLDPTVGGDCWKLLISGFYPLQPRDEQNEAGGSIVVRPMPSRKTCCIKYSAPPQINRRFWPPTGSY